ncbi:MAG: SRPBCC family protein [marine benthic group bacterium]|nr:SRPBCC family protein [Gemmatimonadota bacterium]
MSNFSDRVSTAESLQMRTLEDRIQINAPHAVVWGLLSDFSGVATWAPYLRSSSPVGDVESGVGAYRVMRHFWGFRLEESVVEWDDGSGFEFDVVRVPFPIKAVRETWRIEDAEDHVVVATRVEYDTHLGPVGAAIDAAIVSLLVRREMREGLKGLKRYAETVATGLPEVAEGEAIA